MRSNILRVQVQEMYVNMVRMAGDIEGLKDVNNKAAKWNREPEKNMLQYEQCVGQQTR